MDKNATTLNGTRNPRKYLTGHRLRVMEFAQDGGAMVYAPDGTEIAMVEECDIRAKFKCCVVGDMVMHPDLADDIFGQVAYQTKVLERKGGYEPILKELVIAASLHRGEFCDSVLWAKQREEDALKRQMEARINRKGQTTKTIVEVVTEKPQKITFRVKNDTKQKQKIVLFNAAATFTTVNFALPADVSVIGIYDTGETTSYLDFLAQTMAEGKLVSVISSTNNRKLSFFCRRSHMPEKYPMEPRLTKKGHSRPRKKDRQYLMKWNYKKWNIADTHEYFVLDHGVECQLYLGPYQEFNLTLRLLS